MDKRNDEILDAQTYKGRFLPRIWPGMYPATYVTQGGAELCHDCANEAGDDEMDPVVDVYVLWEGSPNYCDGCGVEMRAAYGDHQNPNTHETWRDER